MLFCNNSHNVKTSDFVFLKLIEILRKYYVILRKYYVKKR